MSMNTSSIDVEKLETVFPWEDLSEWDKFKSPISRSTSIKEHAWAFESLDS